MTKTFKDHLLSQPAQPADPSDNEDWITEDEIVELYRKVLQMEVRRVQTNGTIVGETKVQMEERAEAQHALFAANFLYLEQFA